MSSGLRILLDDFDESYLGITIHARNERYSGTTYIYAEPNDLTKLAEKISNFPTSGSDEKIYELGSLDPKRAGGYCRVRFYTLDSQGHIALEIQMNDDDSYYKEANAKFHFSLFPVNIDLFIQELNAMQAKGFGEANLRGTS